MRDFAFGAFIGRARDNRVVDVSSKRNVFFGFVVFESAQKPWSATAREATTSLPRGTGWACSAPMTSGSWTTRSGTTPGPGIHVEDSPDNLIKGNRFSHNRPGILLEADRNRVRRNRFARNGAGLLVNGSRNVVARNRLSQDGLGIGIEKGRRNLVARNVVIDARGRGISLGLDFADGTSIGGVDNIVRRNVVRGSGGDGFLVNKKGSSLLKRNLASGAEGDGFHIESRSTRLTKNRAPRNAAIGIEAVQGVIDGGGNRANGNGGPRQCVNVRCH